jgi:hypothetical protein
MTRLLLIAGRRKSGKDTTAAILSRVYGAHVDSFADGFKAFAATAFSVPPAWVWGASELREQKIPGLDVYGSREWELAAAHVTTSWGFQWLTGLLRDMDGGRSWASVYWTRGLALHKKLCLWFEQLRTEASENGGLTVRHLLQQLGTEFGREQIHADVWAITGARRALRKAQQDGQQLAVILDGRFPNEVDAIRAQGGLVVRLIDPNAPPPDPTEHVSERALDEVPVEHFDAVIHNDKTKGVDALAREILGVVKLLIPDVKERP